MKSSLVLKTNENNNRCFIYFISFPPGKNRLPGNYDPGEKACDKNTKNPAIFVNYPRPTTKPATGEKNPRQLVYLVYKTLLLKKACFVEKRVSRNCVYEDKCVILYIVFFS